MSNSGDVFENPVTGERAVVRIGTQQTDGELLVVDLYVRPGGAVMGEHFHPNIEERFTVLSGMVGCRIAGRASIAAPGTAIFVAAGLLTSGGTPVPMKRSSALKCGPQRAFKELILNTFGLAQDGKMNSRGMPNLLQLSVLAWEFDDVVRFTRPPRLIQRVLFALAEPPARWLGYRGSYQKYLDRRPSSVVAVEPLDRSAAFCGYSGLALERLESPI